MIFTCLPAVPWIRTAPQPAGSDLSCGSRAFRPDCAAYLSPGLGRRRRRPCLSRAPDDPAPPALGSSSVASCVSNRCSVFPPSLFEGVPGALMNRVSHTPRKRGAAASTRAALGRVCWIRYVLFGSTGAGPATFGIDRELTTHAVYVINTGKCMQARTIYRRVRLSSRLHVPGLY